MVANDRPTITDIVVLTVIRSSIVSHQHCKICHRYCIYAVAQTVRQLNAAGDVLILFDYRVGIGLNRPTSSSSRYLHVISRFVKRRAAVKLFLGLIMKSGHSVYCFATFGPSPVAVISERRLTVGY